MNRPLTKRELSEIEQEIDQINLELEWRNPNKGYTWFEWADARVKQLIKILENAYVQARMHEMGLTVIEGGNND